MEQDTFPSLSLNFPYLLLLTRVQLRAALCSKNAISLSLNKEMAKENQLKGLMPLRNPPCVFAGEAFASQHDPFRQGEI